MTPRSYRDLSLLLCLLCLGSQQLHAQTTLPSVEYLEQPIPEWTTSLGNNGPLGDGNGVTLAPDGSALFLTTSTGTFVALTPDFGSLRDTVDAPMDADTAGWTVSCRSGVAVTQNTNTNRNSNVVAYAVRYEPPEDDFTSRVKSRVVAVDTSNLNRLSILWMSELLDGTVEGTPIISWKSGGHVVLTLTSVAPPDPPTAAPTQPPTLPPTAAPAVATTGMPVTTAPVSASPVATTGAPVSGAPAAATVVTAVTGTPIATTTAPTLAPVAADPDITTRHARRNRRRMQASSDSATIGYFVVLHGTSGVTLLSESSTTAIDLDQRYAPIGVARNVTNPDYASGGGELFVWHSPSPTSDNGEVQLFQFPASFNANNVNASALSTVRLGNVPFVTNTAPVLNAAGDTLFFAASGASIQGWVDDRAFALLPNFQVSLLEGEGSANALAPPNPMLLSPNDNDLYVSTAADTLVKVYLGNDTVAWRDPPPTDNDGPDSIVTTPVLSPDRQRLYLARGNALYVKDAATGEDLITRPVTTRDGSLLASEFCMSLTGEFLYYVGVERNLVTALKVANPPGVTEVPSAEPSLAPSASAMPTSGTSDMPSVTPVAVTRAPTRNSSPNSGSDSNSSGSTESKNNTGLYAGIAGGVVGGILLIGVLVYFFLRLRGSEDDGIETGYNYGGDNNY